MRHRNPAGETGGSQLSIPIGPRLARFTILALVGATVAGNAAYNREMAINSRAVDRVQLDQAKKDFLRDHPDTVKFSQLSPDEVADFGLGDDPVAASDPTNAHIAAADRANNTVILPSPADVGIALNSDKEEAKHTNRLRVMEFAAGGFIGGLFGAGVLSLLAGDLRRRPRPAEAPSGDTAGPSQAAPKV